jgi:hypothetical protein
MTYGDWHKESMCDKCGKDVGKKNLFRVPFLYLDCNDKSHPDVSHLAGYSGKVGYRQYEVCVNCLHNC